MQTNFRRNSSNSQIGGATNHRSASRSASFKLGKRGTAGNPAPSWIPNIRRESTYDSRPNKSIRQQMPETFRHLEPEQGSRIFISGLPKDITNQDLEDLMTSQIGPTREVYIIHQYSGSPLYRASNVTASGLERDPNAESADNIRALASMGCGMVHFQREKDALEAWEQYNGKLLDGESKILRVQIVVDADESWLAPQENRAEAPAMPESETQMEIEPTYEPPEQPRAAKPASHSPGLPARPDIRRGVVAASAVRPARNAPTPVQQTKTKQPAKPTYTGVKPLSNRLSNLPLISRIGGSSALVVETPTARTSRSVAIGEHSIAMSGSTAGTPVVQINMRVTLPRGKVKKGPRRLAKLEARNQVMRDGVTTVGPSASRGSFSPHATNGMPHPPSAKPTLVDLDAEMEEYRRTGLMGLSSPRG